MQCNESESKVARFVLKLISKSYIEQSLIKLHLMMILWKQKSSPDQSSIIVHHLTKMFIFFFCLSTLYLMYYGGLYFVYWIRQRCGSRSQDKILMKSIKIRIFYIFLSKTSHIASIDIDLPHWQEGHCRALYYLKLTGYHFSASYWCQSLDWEVMSWYRRPSPPLSGHPAPNNAMSQTLCNISQKRNVSGWKVKSFQLDSNPTPAWEFIGPHFIVI